MQNYGELLGRAVNYRQPVGYSVWVREDNGDWTFVKDGFVYWDRAERWARRKVSYRRWQVRRPIERRVDP